jgi:two-component sensor histidine kinase
VFEAGPPDLFARLHRSLPRPGSVISYSIGAAIVGACAVLKLLLDGAVGAAVPPFITFYPAVVIASLLGGPAVGLAAAGTTIIVAWYFWLPPALSFAIADTLSGTTLAIYAFTAPMIALIVGVARLSLDRAAASESERSAAARESVHRTKNLIAVVQALSSKVAREVNTAMEFKQVLGKRLQALGIAQDVLLRRDWQDADLEELLQSALAPFLPNPGLTLQRGEHVLVPARHVPGLCMALYELCTNAMKYGALAYGRGPATLSWHLVENDCVLEWREEVSSGRIEQSGYGTTLIRMALSNDAGTIVRYEVSPMLVFASFRWADAARAKRTQPHSDARPRDQALPGYGTNANQASATV